MPHCDILYVEEGFDKAYSPGKNAKSPAGTAGLLELSERLMFL
jgi:hypothetical protein